MDYGLFISDIIQKLITSIPQLVAVITMVGLSLGKVKKATSKFPAEVTAVKDTLKLGLDTTKELVRDMLDESRTAFNSMLKEATTQLREQVTEVMGGMQRELSTYREQIQGVKSQANLLVKENRALFDLVITLVAKNPELVKKGLSKTITDSLTLTQVELKDYAVQMIDSLPLLQAVLTEALGTYTPEQVDTILESVGYERKG